MAAAATGNASSDLWVATITLSEPGTVGYFCEPHGSPGAGMFGTIQVLAPAVPATPAPWVGSVWLSFAAGDRVERDRGVAPA